MAFVQNTETQELNGLLKKLRKIHKKIHKPVQKLMPKPLRKFDKKMEAKIDKLSENKTLNKIGDVAAVAVGSYFFPPLASMAKKKLAETVIKKGVQHTNKRRSRKERKKLQREIAALQKEQQMMNAAQGSAVEMVKTLPPEAQERLAYLAKTGGVEALKSPEALELMKPAIIQTAEQTAYKTVSAGGEYGQAEAAQAVAEQTEDRVDEAATRSFLKSNWPFLALFAGGAVLLYMNRSKAR